jgi:hypothetical protein
MVEYKAIVPPYYSTPATILLLPRYSSPFLSSCFSHCYFQGTLPLSFHLVFHIVTSKVLFSFPFILFFTLLLPKYSSPFLSSCSSHCYFQRTLLLSFHLVLHIHIVTSNVLFSFPFILFFTLLLPKYSSPFLSSYSFSFCFAICLFLLFLSLVFFFFSYPPFMIFDLLQLF